jgi:hypothetical protein
MIVKKAGENENDLFSEINSWIQKLEMRAYLYVQEFSGHMRRILMTCPSLFLNSTIELFAYALFQYQFINTTSRKKSISRTLSAQEKIDELENIEHEDFKKMVMANMRRISEQTLKGMPNVPLKELVKGDTEDFFAHLDLKEKRKSTDPKIPSFLKVDSKESFDTPKLTVLDTSISFEEEIANQVCSYGALTPWALALKHIIRNYNTIFKSRRHINI